MKTGSCYVGLLSCVVVSHVFVAQASTRYFRKGLKDQCSIHSRDTIGYLGNAMVAGRHYDPVDTPNSTHVLHLWCIGSHGDSFCLPNFILVISSNFRIFLLRSVQDSSPVSTYIVSATDK